MKVLNIKKATPIFSGIITTSERYTEDESTHNGILDTTKLGQIKDIQKVISTSEQAIARGVKSESIVLLDFKRYARSKQKKNSLKETTDDYYDSTITYEIPTILLDDREHLLIDVSDVSLIVDEFEWCNEGVDEVSDNNIILN